MVSSHRLLGKEELGIKASVIDSLFPEIILKIFPGLKKRVYIPIKKIFRISARHDKRRNSMWPIVIKMSKLQNKEKEYSNL